ncbi:MAG TPA: hypothetical protein VIJ14_03940 [Rhabdochlamydiaceae bacterium]
MKATPQRQQSQCVYDVISCDENTVNENEDGRTASGASEDDREEDENEGEDSEVYSEGEGDFEEAEDILEGEENDQEGGEENDQEGGENDFERDDEEMYISRTTRKRSSKKSPVLQITSVDSQHDAKQKSKPEKTSLMRK